MDFCFRATKVRSFQPNKKKKGVEYQNANDQTTKEVMKSDHFECSLDQCTKEKC